MSGNPFAGVIVPERVVRDFVTTIHTDVNITFDISNQFNTLGLDFFIRNRGAAAATVSIQGGLTITVDPGDVYTFNDTKYWLVAIGATDDCEIQLFGIHANTLRAKGLLK